MPNRAERIADLLHPLDPIEIEIVNDSKRHAGHAADDGSGETHYTIILNCARFSGLSRLERHRLIHQLLAREFALGLHALTLRLWAPDEIKPG